MLVHLTKDSWDVVVGFRNAFLATGFPVCMDETGERMNLQDQEFEVLIGDVEKRGLNPCPAYVLGRRIL